MTAWLIRQNGEQFGPYSWEELQAYAADGSLEPEGELWTEGMSEWAGAHTVEGLFADLPVEGFYAGQAGEEYGHDLATEAGPAGEGEVVAAASGGKSFLLPALVICAALLLLAAGGVFALRAVFGGGSAVEAGEEPAGEEALAQLPLLPLDLENEGEEAIDEDLAGPGEPGEGEESEGEEGDDAGDSPAGNDNRGNTGGNGAGTTNPGASSTPGGGSSGGSSPAPGSPGGSNPAAPAPGGSGNGNVHEASSPATVNLDTNPRGAQVLVNGTYVGNTPHTLRLRPGSHVITFRKAGYYDTNGRITVESGGTYFLTESLVPRQGAANPEEEDEEEDNPEVTPLVPPVASFTFSRDLPFDDFTFNAGASSSVNGAITDYHWCFGDGSEANGEVVEHGFIAANTYTVTLTVTDAEGMQASHSESVTVIAQAPQPVTAHFIVESILVPVGESVTFNAAGSVSPNGRITSYRWCFGDGNEGETDNSQITHTFASAGNYPVSLLVTDIAGMEGFYIQIVEVVHVID